MDFQPADLAIILICAATCGYCFLLGRRLSALHDTKKGLGAAIITFTRSVADISSTARATTARASELAIQLSDLIEQAHKACQKVDEVTAQIESKRGQALADLKSTQSDLSTLLQQAQTLQHDHDRHMRTVSDDLFGLTETVELPPLSEGLTRELRRRTDRMKAIVDYDAS